MSINDSVINQGNPVKSSIPLVANKFGRGFGLAKPAQSEGGNEKEILISLSRSASKYSSEIQQGQSYGSISKSPLNQALDSLSDISAKIADLQDKYSKAASGSEQSESLSSELKSLANEFKRITSSNILKISSDSSSLDFTDSLVKSTMNSGNQDRIAALKNGLEDLSSLSFDEILSDNSISGKINEFIKNIKSALEPQSAENKAKQDAENLNQSVLITVPQAAIKTIGQAEGLSVSLLSYSNEDLIKAAAAHMDIDSTNVLLLTYNASEPEEESEQEKEQREKKAQKIEIENPSELPTLAER